MKFRPLAVSLVNMWNTLVDFFRFNCIEPLTNLRDSNPL